MWFSPSDLLMPSHLRYPVCAAGAWVPRAGTQTLCSLFLSSIKHLWYPSLPGPSSGLEPKHCLCPWPPSTDRVQKRYCLPLRPVSSSPSICSFQAIQYLSWSPTPIASSQADDHYKCHHTSPGGRNCPSLKTTTGSWVLTDYVWVGHHQFCFG